jgi:hypothetical protein
LFAERAVWVTDASRAGRDHACCSRHVSADSASETSEFLQLSDDHQATYVEGILQGMSYVMLNYDRAGFEKWDACVRTQSLEATVVDVLRLLKENPNENRNTVPWAVTRAVSQRC